ncbi:hypothetical protein C2E23DRAFT_891279 [Lenzites betulinus]|nr:hypothetical protein C2E23DRAFT_891279 [Lenzites betulinus]
MRSKACMLTIITDIAVLATLSSSTGAMPIANNDLAAGITAAPTATAAFAMPTDPPLATATTPGHGHGTRSLWHDER